MSLHAMTKIIFACLDGTGSQIERNLSNVLNFFVLPARIMSNGEIGTLGPVTPGLAGNRTPSFRARAGYGLDEGILGAYDFICRHTASDGH
jgi:hypothetical protein